MKYNEIVLKLNDLAKLNKGKFHLSWELNFEKNLSLFWLASFIKDDRIIEEDLLSLYDLFKLPDRVAHADFEVFSDTKQVTISCSCSYQKKISEQYVKLTKGASKKFDKLIQKLKKENIQTCMVKWEGYGDSGGIEDFEFTENDDPSVALRQEVIEQCETLAPDISEVDEAGYWIARINVEENTLTYESCRYFLKELLFENKVISPEEQPIKNEHSRSALKTIEKVKEGLAPKVIMKEDNTLDVEWLPFNLFKQDSGLSEEAHKLAVKAIKNISKGTPPWLEPLLNEDSLVLFRILFNTYPYNTNKT